MTKLTVQQVNGLLGRLSREGLSPRTGQLRSSNIRVVLHDAERESRVVRNVAALARAIPAEGHEVRALASDQVLKLLEAAEEHADGSSH